MASTDSSEAPRGASDAPAQSLWSLVRFILVVVALAWTLRSFIVAPFSIPSGSMLPTLYIG
ncbi:MAG TPA: S26 family signal peptidase, partial [Sphingomicrobium sp.]|nr:S26 family signal peptidase [Sphingomicrobium sp.]